jgi:hypothetical protein
VSAIDPSAEPLGPGGCAGLGRHLASFTEDPEEQFGLLAPTFAAALAQGCRCLFIGHRTTRPALSDALARRGCDIAEPLASGQFRFVTADQTYLQGGFFDADRMLELWEEEVGAAREGGCRGLCASGEVTWLHQQVPGSDRWLEYEYRINELDGMAQIGVTCVYDTGTLPAWLAPEIAKVHPFIHTNRAVTVNAGYVSGPDHAAEVPLAEEIEPPADSLPCTQLELLLSAYADGQLIRRRREEVTRHLDACEACAQQVKACRSLKLGLASLRTPAPVAAGFWDAVRACLAEAADPSG